MKQPSHLELIDLRVTHFIYEDNKYYAFYQNNALESICVHTCDGSYVALKEGVAKKLENILNSLEIE